jgi:hypothetical protein
MMHGWWADNDGGLLVYRSLLCCGFVVVVAKLRLRSWPMVSVVGGQGDI